MVSDADPGQNGGQELDTDDTTPEKPFEAPSYHDADSRAGGDARAGTDDARTGADARTGTDDARAGESSRAEASLSYPDADSKAGGDSRAGASPAPTIHEEPFDASLYPEAEPTPPVTYFQDLGYGSVPAARRSLWDVISQLPEQYINVITHPWTGVFVAERGKADWDIVWIQLLGNAVIAGVLGFLSTLIPFAAPANAPGTATGIQSPGVAHALNLSTTIGLIIFIPAIFFIGSGILRLLSKGFGAYGSFLEQCYTTLLFQVPFGVAISVVRMIPFIGGFFFWFGGLVLLLYGVVLQILATMVVHDFPSDKATSVVIITAIILIPVTILLFAFLTFIFAVLP